MGNFFEGFVGFLIIIAIVGGIWFSGYYEGVKLSEAGEISVFTVEAVASDMKRLKRSGFMFYVKHRTNYYSQLNKLLSEY